MKKLISRDIERIFGSKWYSIEHIDENTLTVRVLVNLFAYIPKEDFSKERTEYYTRAYITKNPEDYEDLLFDIFRKFIDKKSKYFKSDNISMIKITDKVNYLIGDNNRIHFDVWGENRDIIVRGWVEAELKGDKETKNRMMMDMMKELGEKKWS